MRGTINIGEKSIDMVANGATPFIYKKVFRRDFLASTAANEKEPDMDAFTQLGFIMAMQAQKPLAELVNGLKIEDFYEWIEGFEALDLVTHATEIFALYQAQAEGSSVPKKKR